MMKARYFPVLLAGAFLCGCNNQNNSSGAGSNSAVSKTNSESATGNPLTAPVDYLGAVGAGQQRAVKTVDLASVNQAIQLFQAQEGRYPRDLDELVQGKYLGKIPTPPYGLQLVYDPVTGQASMVKK